MIYFTNDGYFINKYDIELDSKKLKELRGEIILKCSFISHKSYITTQTPNYYNGEHIKNYKETPVGNKIHVEYDYYTHPKLVTYINELLLGNVDCIDKIRFFKDDEFDINDLDLLKELRELAQNDLLSNCDIKRLKEIQSKLNNSKANKDSNKNQVPASSYREAVLSSIKFKEIGSLLLSEATEVLTFFDNKGVNIPSHELTKLLQTKKR